MSSHSQLSLLFFSKLRGQLKGVSDPTNRLLSSQCHNTVWSSGRVEGWMKQASALVFHRSLINTSADSIRSNWSFFALTHSHVPPGFIRFQPVLSHLSGAAEKISSPVHAGLPISFCHSLSLEIYFGTMIPSPCCF